MDIRKIVVEIQDANITNKEAHFTNIYPDFVKQYPNIFQMACNTKIDIANLDFMLEMLEKMNKKETTQYDASAAVGQMLFDKYVEPKIKK